MEERTKTITCPGCDGSGRNVELGGKCPDCQGTGKTIIIITSKGN